MRKRLLGEVVLDNQRTFRGGLMLVLLLLVLSNGWFVYSRELRLSDQHAQHALELIQQHFGKIYGYIDTIQAEATRELQWGESFPVEQELLLALQNAPEGDYLTLDHLPPAFSHHLIGNLTAQGRTGELVPQRRHEMGIALGLAPMMSAAYRNLDHNGVAWVYYVSARQFIYLYPYVSGRSYHYSAETSAGLFWRMALPIVNPDGRRVMTPVYIDQAGKGPMLTISQPIWANGRFYGVLCMDITITTLQELMGRGGDEMGSLYLLNAQNQIVAASDEQPLPQENLLRLPLSSDYIAGPTAHVKVSALGDSGMRVVHYLPNSVLAGKILRGAAPGMVAALLLWLALELLNRTWLLNRQLRRLSEHDPLTGALNHRAFQAVLAQLFQAYRERGEVFALVMVDLDHFKQVNDTFGHAVGDEVLKVLVRLALRLLRSQDMVARLGGEEFVLVLPATGLRDAMKAAVRLRLQLERLNWSRLGLPDKVTASMGCAVVLSSDSTPGAVLKRADDAMYRAKQEGRNRVCLDLQGQPPGVQ